MKEDGHREEEEKVATLPLAAAGVVELEHEGEGELEEDGPGDEDEEVGGNVDFAHVVEAEDGVAVLELGALEVMNGMKLVPATGARSAIDRDGRWRGRTT